MQQLCVSVLSPWHRPCSSKIHCGCAQAHGAANWHGSCCFWRQTCLLWLPKLNVTFSTPWEEMFHSHLCRGNLYCYPQTGRGMSERVEGLDRSSKLASVEACIVNFQMCAHVGAACTAYALATLHFCSLFIWGFLLSFCLTSRVVLTLLPWCVILALLWILKSWSNVENGFLVSFKEKKEKWMNLCI